MHLTMRKKPIWKSYVLCVKLYDILEDKTMETVKRSEIEWMNRPSTEDFLVQLNYFLWSYNDRYMSPLDQIHRIYNTKREPYSK